MLSSLLVLGLFACGFTLLGASSIPADSAHRIFGPAPNLAAKAAHKLYFGTATNNEQWNDTTYFKILTDGTQFGQVTPANNMKWENIEPEPDVFSFGPGDALVALARRNGMLVRGHNCVWYNQLQTWVTNTSWTAPQLRKVVQNHCSTIVRRWADAWDVINEAFNDDGTYRETVFFNTLNTSYISLALHAARAADPHAKLYINDFNIESSGPKATALKNLVRTLKREGVPIDGVGVQSHLIVGQVPKDFQKNLAEFAALGVEVAVTELDVRFASLPPNAAGLAQQRKDYAAVVNACKNVPRCVGVTVWDFTDKYSWIPSTFAGQGDACPWDANYVRRPAYFGILDGFKGI